MFSSQYKDISSHFQVKMAAVTFRVWRDLTITVRVRLTISLHEGLMRLRVRLKFLQQLMNLHQGVLQLGLPWEKGV